MTNVSPNKKPAKLTAEIVIKQYGPMIRKLIRNFKIVSQSESDLFHSCLDHLITPSTISGTTPLDRYDPKIAYASTYITTIVSNYLKGVYRVDRRELELFKTYRVDPVTGNKVAVKLEKVITVEEVYDPSDLAITRRRLLKALRTKKNKDFASKTAAGKPRNTFRVALMLLSGKTISEIAEITGVSTVEIRRRLGILRQDPTLRRIAEDYGWSISSQATG